MPTAAELFNLSIEHQRAGRLPLAEQCLRQVLQLDPGHAEAMYLLGGLAYVSGRLDAAGDLVHEALIRKPGVAAWHADLGLVRLRQGRLEESVACFRRAVDLQPDHLDALVNLALALHQLGRLDDAILAYRRALQVKADLPHVLNNLGTALHARGDFAAAADCYRHAIRLEPRLAEAHNNLGNILKQHWRPDEALACYRRALELQPDYADAHNNLGTILLARGPGSDAIACFRRALELKPDLADAHTNLGNALFAQGQLTHAEASHRRAIELNPHRAEAHSNLANALKDQGRLDEAVAAYRRALELNPDLTQAHGNLLQTLHYRAGVTLAELADAHAEFDRRHAAPLRRPERPYTNSRDPNRKLRLGFLSADLRRHPVGFFTIPFLENLDRDQAEAICYYDCPVGDEVTERFRTAAADWREILGRPDEQLAEQIRADGIDILFDLAGHTAHNRILVFARKPAPIQVTWAGYVGTTGVSAMDYLVADQFEVPPGSEVSYSERILRMPDDYVCYDPPAYAPPVGPLPALQRGQVTFGSFNYPAKIGPQVIAVWAEMLRRLPAARLVLKHRAVNDPSIAGRWNELFTGRGIPADRVEYRGWSSHAEMLREYGEVDVALDPFPYSGGLTTIEALWMGAPVITCPGETFAGRHSLSHLSNIGLTETIARDLDEYIDIAVALANDLPRLAELRSGLRGRVAASPLCDGKRFADGMLRQLREAWREWVTTGRQ
jgi:predicted O-linked N-acetylglucosamine transferase (SPINDLY family)